LVAWQSADNSGVTGTTVITDYCDSSFSLYYRVPHMDDIFDLGHGWPIAGFPEFKQPKKRISFKPWQRKSYYGRR